MVIFCAWMNHGFLQKHDSKMLVWSMIYFSHRVRHSRVMNCLKIEKIEILWDYASTIKNLYIASK